MKTATILQFSDLMELCKYIKCIHANAYRIDTTQLTIKISLTDFEIAIAVEQFRAMVVTQTEIVN